MKNFILILSLLIMCGSVRAQVILPAVFSDGMIIQRDQPIKIWGWASPKEKINIEFNAKKVKTQADSEGKWVITLSSMPADGITHQLVIKGKNTVSVKDILLGDVYFCSGQSNMVHQMNIHDVTYALDIEHANYPEIKQFWVPNVTNLVGPSEKLSSSEWVPAIGDKVRPFSAVAYFFARNLFNKYHVPIGIINASWGGTPIEAWTSANGLKDFNSIVEKIQLNKDTAYVNKNNFESFQANPPRVSKDQGMESTPRWYETAYTPKGWKAINVPGYWEDQGIKNLDGVVWYRKTIHLSKSHLKQSAQLWLGRIVDADEVYVNGEKIGGFGYMYPQRRYKVTENILKEGENTIVVKVTNHFGKGGFVPDKPYALIINKDTMDLKGEWHYKVGEVFEPKKPAGPPMIVMHNQPTALYNAMVHPLINYTIKGVLWYQGESNIGNAAQYDQLLEALITDWRSRWQNPALPVIFAQLPGFMEYNYLPSESGWALHREATLKATKIPNTAMTVNIDLGEWNDIHPENKKDVGERMALAAYNLIYGENTVSSGPIYKSHQIKRNQIIVEFDPNGSALTTRDGESLQEFAIADETKKFRWAKAKIEGNTIVVWHEEIQNPKYVRYAWADNPVNPNLVNKEGLPASPFRTDH